MDTNLIPRGEYCYKIEKILKDGYIQIENCPYWYRREDKDDHENGYCAFLKCGDWEGNTLLTDQLKHCGINLDEK